MRDLAMAGGRPVRSGPAGPLGWPRRHLRRVDSTNRVARQLAVAGAPSGTLVTASEQTAGRGRQGRSWSAPAGQSLLASLVLRDPPTLLALRAGVAVAEVAERLDAMSRRAAVKWPNDVLLDGGKVAGILVEAQPQHGWGVLGVGLNVALDVAALAPEIAARAATLGRSAAEIEDALTELVAALAQWLVAPEAAVLEALRARDPLRGRTVRLPDGATGTGAGIDAAGRLLVDTDSGTRAVDAGEIHLGA